MIFDTKIFKVNVLSRLDGYGLSDSEKADITQALEDEVFCEDFEGDESALRRAIADFEHGGYQPISGGRRRDAFTFSDSWEINGKAYTYHFLWCLYAIVWAIQQYDRMKTESTDGQQLDAAAAS